MGKLCPKGEGPQERDPNLAWMNRERDSDRVLRSLCLEGVSKDEQQLKYRFQTRKGCILEKNAWIWSSFEEVTVEIKRFS